MEKSNRMIKYPFKFNYLWLEEEDFIALVKNHWFSLNCPFSNSPSLTLVHQLKFLKSMAMKWERDKKAKLKEDL